MATAFTRRVWIVIPANKRDEVNAGLDLLGYGSANFPLGVIPDGEDDDAEITNYVSYWQMNAQQWTNFLALCGNYPLIKYDELDESGRLLVSTNLAGSQLAIGTPMDMDDHLSHHEFKRRVVAIE